MQNATPLTWRSPGSQIATDSNLPPEADMLLPSGSTLRITFSASVALALKLSFATSLLAEPYTFDAGKEEATVTVAPSIKATRDAIESIELFSGVLSKITGSLPAGSDSLEQGIVFATAEELPEIAKEAGLDPQNPYRREEYLLRTNGKRLLIVGATPIAVRRAMADILHRWGYRQFFPSADWEVLPRGQTLTLDLDTVERPAYASRILFTTSYLDGEEADFNRWLDLNRMGQGFALNTRHSYHAIYKRHQEVFDAHPEYFGLVDGKRHVARKTERFKFNAANEDLLKLIVADAREEFRKPDATDSISMDPSDFGGWDNSGEAFKTLGKPSNQAVTIANRVAKEVAAPLGKSVGMYAYYDHQFAPDIEVEPNIIVSFATRFLKPGQDLYRNIAAWREKGAQQVGIRDYSSVFEWDCAMPGRALGGNLSYLEETLPRYRELGASFYTSEMQSAWGAYGLGFYLTSQLLWNPQQKSEAIIDDFLQKAFGPAAAPMETFFSRLNGDDSVLARHTTPAQLYAPLVEALDAAQGDAKVEKRIMALLAYVRYTELFAALERLPQEKKQAVLEEVYDLLFRAAPFQILPTRAIALHPRAGLRRSFSLLSHRSQAAYKEEIEKAASRPLTREELLGYAKKALQAGPQPIMSVAPLPEPQQVAAAPWIRNSAAFTFALNGGETVDLEISLRRFGFSGFPRYVVLGPEAEKATSKTILKRGHMTGEKETIPLSAGIKGTYTLVFESTPNLVQCKAPKPYYLNPTADSGAIDFVTYRGALYFDIPGGKSAAFAIGGQGSNEKIFASVAINDKVHTKGRNYDGLQPLTESVTAPEEAPARVRITLRKPTDGYYEDHFLQFQGDFVTPVSLSPLP